MSCCKAGVYATSLRSLFDQLEMPVVQKTEKEDKTATGKNTDSRGEKNKIGTEKEQQEIRCSKTDAQQGHAGRVRPKLLLH
jgi:hypothetical protein